MDGPDPGEIRNQRFRISHAVEDKEKVGFGVQPVGYEELEVPSRLLALAVNVCDERAFDLRGGCCVPGDGACGTGEVMYRQDCGR